MLVKGVEQQRLLDQALHCRRLLFLQRSMFFALNVRWRWQVDNKWSPVDIGVFHVIAAVFQIADVVGVVVVVIVVVGVVGVLVGQK